MLLFFITSFIQAAIYGMSQSIPDRSMVGEIATLFLEALYNLKTLPKANGIA